MRQRTDVIPTAGNGALRVGILEDEKYVVEILIRYVRSMKSTPIVFRSGKEVLRALSSNTIDILLLDLGLADEDGIDVIRRIRIGSKLPIVIVSGRVEMASVAAGLDAGADDYVRKPIGLEELGARIRSVLRRATQQGEDPQEAGRQTTLHFDGMLLECDRLLLRGHLGEVSLTDLEMLLLVNLINARGATIARDELSRSLWGQMWDHGSRTLDVHISNLRKKLRQAGGGAHLLKASRNSGYRYMVVVEM